VAAMIAVERGYFSPQDEVQKYILSFKDIKEAVLRGRYYSPNLVLADPDKKPGIFSRIAGALIGWLTGVYIYKKPSGCCRKSLNHDS
jgi:hypothetical protein